MVCPYRHVADYPEITPEEAAEMALLTQQAMSTLRSVSSVQGFNIGMNQGAVAGAGIAAHLHQHVVPRWLGDQNFMPVIGQTKTLPELLAGHPQPARGGVGRLGSGDRVRVLGRASLEAEDRRVDDRPLPDLDRPPDRLVRVPRVRTRHHDRQERQQRLAVLPGRGVPQVRRTVVHRVVVAPCRRR